MERNLTPLSGQHAYEGTFKKMPRRPKLTCGKSRWKISVLGRENFALKRYAPQYTLTS